MRLVMFSAILLFLAGCGMQVAQVEVKRPAVADPVQVKPVAITKVVAKMRRER